MSTILQSGSVKVHDDKHAYVAEIIATTLPTLDSKKHFTVKTGFHLRKKNPGELHKLIKEQKS